MSCLSWNCRGIGNQWTVQELIDMVIMEKPDVVFLMETLVEESKLEQIRVKLRYDNKLVCPRDGHNGGLVLFWKKTFLLPSITTQRILLMLQFSARRKDVGDLRVSMNTRKLASVKNHGNS